MQQTGNHIIKKTVIDFQYNGTADGFTVQKDVQDWFNEAVVKLGTQMDLLTVADEIISIEQLQLNVNLNERDWKNEATKKILYLLQDRIMLLRSGSVTKTGLKEQKLREHFEEEFFFYLEHGYLSWKITVHQKSNWKKEVEQLFVSPQNLFVKKLLVFIKNNSKASDRLAASVSFPVLFNAVSKLYEQDAAYKNFESDFVLFFELAKNKPQAKKLVTKAFLDIVAEWPGAVYAFFVINGVMELLVQQNILTIKSLKAIPFQSVLFLSEQKLFVAAQEAKKKEGQKIITEKATKTGNHFLEKIEVNQIDQQSFSDSIEEGIFISNAGLIIAAAFLPALFTKLDLYKENELTNYSSAVCLLHYLAQGKKPNEEFELVLPKILCGLRPETLIDSKSFSMPKKWKQEVDDVLSSAIEYWSVLGNTSIKGLRESFLNRNGKLKNDGRDWILQVEQQPYDMLLQHLPWNMTMIQLPWMQNMIKTEWIY